MEAIQSRVETWIKDQRSKIMKVSWGPLQWRMRWPWPSWIINDRERLKKLKEEYERRRKQLQDLCRALKAESISDLQDILSCMVLSECVYKKPASEMIRAVNRFKADFGGQVVSLERVQPSGDHVPHRYLLAEAGDTLFASFIGTKEYKDIFADANIVQGDIFHENAAEDTIRADGTEFLQGETQNVSGESQGNSLESKTKQLKGQPKPAAHRGFLARAKGIPALELYKLAQKKNQKLVLCGHSLGGAVAALATLAILRVVATSSSVKDSEKVQLKCITFSQPPVGNASLSDYVHEQGWQGYFKSYCIPEDLVPRILSPAYFHHYNAQSFSTHAEVETAKQLVLKSKEPIEKTAQKLKESGGDQLVMGLGPVQTSFWRLARLVPLEGFRTQLNKYRGKQVDPINRSSTTNSDVKSSVEALVAEPQSLEIQEGSDGISLQPLTDSNDETSDETMTGKLREKTNTKTGDGKNWRRLPYLPSYVPFGQLYLLGTSSVELLSGAEYSKLTSVGSVIAEVKERFQSHSMKSYRSRFHRIYEMCTSDGPTSPRGMEQLSQLPNVQQWFGLAVAGVVELAHIVESPVIRTATSIVPLGWNGIPGDKNVDPLKVDITGYRLHLCTLVHAQVNGKWCSTTIQTFSSAPSYSTNGTLQPELQKIRVFIGAPLKRPPNNQAVTASLKPVFPSIDSDDVDFNTEHVSELKNKLHRPEGLSDLHIHCVSDFATASKKVHVRTRRVRLLGLEGAGKTSLFKAITAQGKATINLENKPMETDYQEAVAGGVCYCDTAGVNLQDLKMEVSRFKDELWMGIRDVNKKTDMIVLVHNLSHKIPQFNDPDSSKQLPVLTPMLEEAKAAGIPWVLAITNKFSVSAHQQKEAINGALKAYQTSLNVTEIINSLPYVIPTAAASASLSWATATGDSDGRTGVQKLFFTPINLVRMPFQKRETTFTVEGVNSLVKLVHRVLRSNEEASFQELVRERLLVELERERALGKSLTGNSQAKQSSLTAAAVGASLGAGLGVVLALVLGAASALRKP